MGRKTQIRNSKGLGAFARASSNPAGQRPPGGANSQTTDFDSHTTKRVPRAHGYNTQNEEKFIKERATRSIFEEDLAKKPSREAGRSNRDLSWANPSIHTAGFLNQAPD